MTTNHIYVISEELLAEAISGLKTFGQSATQTTVYKLSTLPPVGYHQFTPGTKVLVTRKGENKHFVGTVEAIHSFGPTVGDEHGHAWVVKWEQIWEWKPTPEEIAVQRIKDALAKLDKETIKAISALAKSDKEASKVVDDLFGKDSLDL